MPFRCIRCDGFPTDCLSNLRELQTIYPTHSNEKTLSVPPCLCGELPLALDHKVIYGIYCVPLRLMRLWLLLCV